MSGLGMAIASLGLIYAAFLVAQRLISGTDLPGWTGLMVAILIVGGMQMLMLGVIGEYLWRALALGRNRDEYVIEHIYEGDDG